MAALPPALEISLLGPPRVRRDGEPVAFDTRKATALLAHLALADRPRSREALCELLWPDQDPEHARGALRRTLSTLRKSVGEEWLDTAGDSVALLDGDELEVDVRRFRALAAGDADDLADAVEVFRGELLEGFYVRDSPASTPGTCTRPTRCSASWAQRSARLVRALTERGEYGRAIRHAQRWLALDPLHEPAHRELIRLYALDGDRAAALAQYRDCVRTLSQELGVPPVDETAALFEQVSEGTLVAPAPAAPRPAAGTAARRRRSCRSSAGRCELAALVGAHAAARPDGRAGRDRGRGRHRQVAARARADHDRRRAGAVGALPRGRGGPALRADRRAARRGGAARRAGRRATAAAGRRLAARARARDGRDLPAPMEMSGPAAQARLLEAVAGVLGVGRR